MRKQLAILSLSLLSALIVPANPVAAAVRCSNAGPIESGGQFSDTGILWTCSKTRDTASVFHVSYKYCYLGNSHGASATITTYAKVEGTWTPLDAFSFRTPWDGDGSCTRGSPGTFASRSFTVTGVAADDFRWEYTNGDWRLQISDILVTDDTAAVDCAYAWTWTFYDWSLAPTRVTLAGSSGKVDALSMYPHNACAAVVKCSGTVPVCASTDIFSGYFRADWSGSCALLSIFLDNGFVFNVSPVAGTFVGYWASTAPADVVFSGTFTSNTINPCDMPSATSAGVAQAAVV